MVEACRNLGLAIRELFKAEDNCTTFQMVLGIFTSIWKRIDVAAEFGGFALERRGVVRFLSVVTV
jgi:hypothetical protein